MEETILVTGASGFIGRAVVDALLQHGYFVRAFVHKETSTFTEHAHLTRIVGDIRDLHALESNMVGVSAIVHLAAAKNDEKESDDINVLGAKNIIDACHIAGVQRVINISTQSTKLTRKGLYGSTKAEADRLFHTSPLAVTTLRSSLVYGDATSGIIGTIVRYSNLPIVPMIGNGRATFRPIHREDLAAIIVHALKNPLTEGKIYDIGGKDIIDLNAVTEAIMQTTGRHRPVLHLPIWLSLIIARCCSFLRHPPLTVSNVLGGAEDVAMDMNPFNQDFGAVSVRSFKTGLEEIFGTTPSAEEREARALLQYVLSSVGYFDPDAYTVALCIRAYGAHGLSNTLLPESLLHSRWKLGAMDMASRIRFPESLLQKKLLVAAAIAETQPASAEVLLPKDRSYGGMVLQSINLSISILCKFLLAIPYLIVSSSLNRNAGII